MKMVKSSVITAMMICGPVCHAEVMKLPQPLAKAWEAEVQSSELEFNTKTWIRDLLEGKEVDAAHNWASVDGVLPERLTPLADATYLVLALNNELYQTSFNRLVVLLSRPGFTQSTAWKALEPELRKVYGSLLDTAAITVSKDQITALAKLPWTGIASDLKAFAAVRGGAAAEEALKHITEQQSWTYHVAMSAGLYQAKAGRLDDAIKTLIQAYAGAGENAAAKNSLALAIGRLQYQKTDLKKAEEWYAKTDAKTPEGVAANEELLWVWLRTGETDRLRGTVTALENSYISTHFMPEALVVKTISDMKLCQFDNAKRDFSAFLATNREWAKRIDEAQKKEPTSAPPNVDWYAAYIGRALKERNKEMERVKTLSSDSVAASVPAIGKQKHWTDVATEMTGHITRLEGQLVGEYRRQWRNNGAMLQEAIRKMQFVKIEMASQAEMGAKAHPESEQAAAEATKAVSTIDKASESGWTFPADDGDWPDERLSMRSTGASVCL